MYEFIDQTELTAAPANEAAPTDRPPPDGNVLGVRVSGTITGDDYERFRPVLDERVREFGTVRLLIHMDDFHGWGDLDALWEDAKLDAAHYADVERLAMVGEERWQDWVTRLTDLFAPGDVRYFDEDDLAASWAWIREGVTFPAW